MGYIPSAPLPTQRLACYVTGSVTGNVTSSVTSSVSQIIARR
jgi:hypothetical protein